MNYLAIDTCGEHLTVIVKAFGKSETAYISDSGVKHSEQLMPLVENVLEKVGATVNDMDVFCAVTGPGSFTGIRIGVSAVKGFADATGKKVLGVTSFDTLAYNIKSSKTLATIDANHGHSYVCGYENGKACFEPKFVDNEVIQGLIDEYTLVGYTKYSNLPIVVVDPSEGLKKAVEDNILSATDDVDALRPFYLRLSQAEEGRK